MESVRLVEEFATDVGDFEMVDLEV